jgi:hypothetical protein
MDTLLGLIGGWLALSTLAVGAALVDDVPEALGGCLVGAGMATGIAISGTILILH